MSDCNHSSSDEDQRDIGADRPVISPVKKPETGEYSKDATDRSGGEVLREMPLSISVAGLIAQVMPFRKPVKDPTEESRPKSLATDTRLDMTREVRLPPIP